MYQGFGLSGKHEKLGPSHTPAAPVALTMTSHAALA